MSAIFDSDVFDNAAFDTGISISHPTEINDNHFHQIAAFESLDIVDVGFLSIIRENIIGTSITMDILKLDSVIR